MDKKERTPECSCVMIEKILIGAIGIGAILLSVLVFGWFYGLV